MSLLEDSESTEEEEEYRSDLADDDTESMEEQEYESDMEEDDGDTHLYSWVSRLAWFGDSTWSLLASFLMLVLSVWLVYAFDDSTNTTQTRTPSVYPSLGPIPNIDPPRIFRASRVSDKIRRAYDKDGVVAVRGLLSEDQLQRLDVAAWELLREKKELYRPGKRTQFHTVRQGVVFHSEPSDSHHVGTNVAAVFQDIALRSAVPRFAAGLLQLRNDTTMRLMRDIFLAKDDEQYICGWHVDDTGFWPATAEAPGVNAWIAIDDMPLAGGGGFALAVGSHVAPWRDEAHRVTGSTMTFPVGGFRDAADMVENRTGSGTCNIETAAPHIHRRMEDTMRVYDVRRGDVIFHTRWLFHRTVPFDNAQNREEGLIYRRYSARYGPGSSRIPPGYGLEPSVLWNAENAGRTVDEVASEDGPWYPQCWPNVVEEELRQLNEMSIEKLPVAEERRAIRRKELQPYLNKRTGTGKGGRSPVINSQH